MFCSFLIEIICFKDINGNDVKRYCAWPYLQNVSKMQRGDPVDEVSAKSSLFTLQYFMAKCENIGLIFSCLKFAIVQCTLVFGSHLKSFFMKNASMLLK